jgi:cytochrome subunit of sulfide dehydrogenase
MNRMLIVALSTAWLLPAVARAAPDPHLVDSCNDCHGDQGVTTAQDVPTIAGVSPAVQSEAFRAYKAKSQPCATVSYKRGDTKRHGDMCSVAARLSDAEVTALADHYARLPYAPLKQPVDAAQAAAGKAVHDRDCRGCHSNGGRDPADDAGILGGQPAGWLRSTLADFKAAKAEQPKKMREKMTKLSDADVEALAQYYASEQ